MVPGGQVVGRKDRLNAPDVPTHHGNVHGVRSASRWTRLRFVAAWLITVAVSALMAAMIHYMMLP